MVIDCLPKNPNALQLWDYIKCTTNACLCKIKINLARRRVSEDSLEFSEKFEDARDLLLVCKSSCPYNF